MMSEEQIKVMPLNNRQRLACYYLVEFDYITIRDYKEVNECDENTAVYELEELVKLGVIYSERINSRLYFRIK